MPKMAKTIAVLGVVAGLGVAAMPLSSSAADTSVSKSLTISAKVNNAISLTIADENDDATTPTNITSLDFGEIGADGQINEKGIKAVVDTNTNKYSLTIKSVDSTTAALREWDETNSQYITSGATIPASDLTDASASGWGYRVLPATSWTAVDTDPTTLTPAGGQDKATKNTNIKFGIRAVSSQKSAAYRGGVTLTATAIE